MFTERKVLRGWQIAGWMKSPDRPKRTRRSLKVTRDGVYLIYAQVSYRQSVLCFTIVLLFTMKFQPAARLCHNSVLYSTVYALHL